VTFASNVAPLGYAYDQAGNVLSDNINQYLYDAEGRICAVANTPVPGMTTMTGYMYNAEGVRVAKGTIDVWSCDPSVSGFKTTKDYILGLSGEQVTEVDVSAGNAASWAHTNAWAAGKLLGTYDTTAVGLHFYLTDPLGTRRVQTTAGGVPEQTCSSLPFGDGETCSTTPTEHLFTGKERDTESGLDYFFARYYSSAMGRFLSPDWSAKAEPVPYAKLDNPQSLNLYAYVLNNPMTGRDLDGHVCILGIGNTCTPAPPPLPKTPDPAHVRPVNDHTVGPSTGRSQPAPKPQNSTFSAGLTINGEAGTGKAGAAASASLNLAVSKRNGTPTSIGLVDNHVAMAYSGDQSVGTSQNGTPTVAGATAGISFTLSAASGLLNDLIGPFQTQSVNTPFLSVQTSTDGSTGVISVSFGASVGASYSNMTTETTVGCIAGCNQ